MAVTYISNDTLTGSRTPLCRTSLEAPLIIAGAHEPAALCVPNIRGGQVGSGPQEDAVRFGWTRVGVRAGEQELAPDLHGCQLRAVVAAVGLAGFEPATS